MDDTSDNSDCDLPDPSCFFQNLDTNRPISPGDIVFAKFKKLYWPALVRNVYPKQKKISIWYCDDPGKTFKLPLRNICLFYDSQKEAEIRKDIAEALCTEAFEGLTSHANFFLERRAKGYNDDPMKFFDQTYPFLEMEKLLKTNPDADVSNIKIPPLYISHEQKKSAKRKSRVSVYESDDSEVIPTDSDSEEVSQNGNAEKSEIAYLWKTSEPSVIEYTDKILKCILSGKANKHLQKIASKSVKSEFYEKFEEAIKYKERDLSSVNFGGPIDDNHKIGELVCYLSSLFNSITKNHSTTKLHKTASSKYPPYSRADAAHFIASVWLPEAIIYAMSTIEKVSLPKAKELFKEHPKSQMKSDMENIVTPSKAKNNLNENKNKTLRSGESKNNIQLMKNEVIKNSNDTVCSPLKKICSNSSKSDEETISSPLRKLCLRTPDPKMGSKIKKKGKATKFGHDKKTSRNVKCNLSEALNKVELDTQNICQKNSKSNCDMKSNKATKLDSDISDAYSMEECEVDKMTEVLGSKYGRRSCRKKVISQNETTTTSANIRTFKNIQCHPFVALDKLEFDAQNVCQKNSKSNCDMKSNKATKLDSDISDTYSVEKCEVDKMTEVLGSKYGRRSCRKKAISQNETMTTPVNNFDEISDVEGMELDKILGESDTKCIVSSSERISKKRKKSLKSNDNLNFSKSTKSTCSKTTNEVKECVSNKNIERYDLRCSIQHQTMDKISKGCDLESSTHPKDNVISKSCEFSNQVIADKSFEITDENKGHKIASPKKISKKVKKSKK